MSLPARLLVWLAVNIKKNLTTIKLPVPLATLHYLVSEFPRQTLQPAHYLVQRQFSQNVYSGLFKSLLNVIEITIVYSISEIQSAYPFTHMTRQDNRTCLTIGKTVNTGYADMICLVCHDHDQRSSCCNSMEIHLSASRPAGAARCLLAAW